MNLEEAILDKVRHLPQAKQEEVLRFADGLQRQNAIGPDAKRDHAEERIWIERNRAAFAGPWVAVEGDRLVASGTDALKVFAAAKSEGIESPFVVHILEEDSVPSYRAGKYRSRLNSRSRITTTPPLWESRCR